MRARRDPEFRLGLLQNAIEALQLNEPDVVKEMLRNYIKATEGYRALAVKSGKPEKSLVRMLSPRGNPTIDSFFSLLSPLLENEGVKLTLTIQRPASRKRKSAARN